MLGTSGACGLGKPDDYLGLTREARDTVTSMRFVALANAVEPIKDAFPVKIGLMIKHLVTRTWLQRI